MENIEYIFLIVGAGGTGGNFAKEFARFMAGFCEPGKSIKAVLIDGDKVEDKNLSRQPFIGEDVQQFKAVALGTAIQETFELSEFYCCPKYIDSSRDLRELVRRFSTYGELSYNGNITIPVVIGCVDNHRARQCMHEFFMSCNTAFYFDAANEFSVGEVVLGARMEGQLIAPDRTYYYPDVLTDDSPSAAELSCGAVNISSPQHLATNLMAANLLLSAVVNVISENTFHGGIVYFDRCQMFSRFLSYTDVAKEGGTSSCKKAGTESSN